LGWGQNVVNVVKTDKCIGISQFFGGVRQACPPKSTPMLTSWPRILDAMHLGNSRNPNTHNYAIKNTDTLTPI